MERRKLVGRSSAQRAGRINEKSRKAGKAEGSGTPMAVGMSVPGKAAPTPNAK
jgi:hypothetical protein